MLSSFLLEGASNSTCRRRSSYVDCVYTRGRKCDGTSFVTMAVGSGKQTPPHPKGGRGKKRKRKKGEKTRPNGREEIPRQTPHASMSLANRQVYTLYISAALEPKVVNASVASPANATTRGNARHTTRRQQGKAVAVH